MRKTAPLILAAALTLAACAGETTADPNLEGGGKNGKAAKKGQHEVVYTVAGTAKKGSISYNTPSGIQQDNDAKLPWVKTLKAENGEPISVSGQNAAGGTITCEIKVDGKVVKQASSKGEFAVVACDGLIGF